MTQLLHSTAEKFDNVFSQIFTLEDMMRKGFSRYYVFKALRDKRAISLRRGIYMNRETWESLAPWEKYGAQAYVYALRSENPVFSHHTAAMFHGFWLLGRPPEKLHVYAPPHSRGTTEGVIKHPFLAEATTTVLSPQGVTVTDVLQTVIDCAKTMPLVDALCIADSALHFQRISLDSLRAELSSYRGRKAQQVHQIAELMSNLSESPGESGTRLLLRDMGLDFVEQYEIITSSGRYRVDFFIPSLNLIIEFDGNVKYTVFGVRAEVEALERRREKELQNLGYVVYRTDWRTVFYNPRKLKGELLYLAQRQ